MMCPMQSRNQCTHPENTLHLQYKSISRVTQYCILTLTPLTHKAYTLYFIVHVLQMQSSASYTYLNHHTRDIGDAQMASLSSIATVISLGRSMLSSGELFRDLRTTG